MRTKQELYQAALRTVALRRQTARANAEDARLEAEAAIPALRHAAHGQDQNGKGGHLHTAAGRTGSRADELQNAHQQLGDGPTGGQVDGIHTGSTG